jgi:putative spermidine/putrescine transport system permease protein
LLILGSLARHWYWPALFPPEYSLRAWADIALPSSGVISALITSVGVALAVTALALIIGLPAAKALGLKEFRGRRTVFFLLLLPVVTPPLASAMGVHALFLRYGLTDSLLGVVLVHLIPAVPYCTLMLSSSFANFDTDWEAQARTLGASPLATWWHVTLPAIAPGVAIAAVFAF